MFCISAASRTLPVLAFCGLVMPGLYAQQSVNNATVSGRVVDPTGAVVQKATVLARQTETGRSSSTETDRDGRFRFPYLKVGSYEIAVRCPGFSDASEELNLSVGSAFELLIPLSLASGSTNITVSEQVAELEIARSQIAGTVSQAEIEQLPLNGRNFWTWPCWFRVSRRPIQRVNQLFAETSAVPGQGISVGSQRNFSNSFIVDGLSANDDAAGLSGPLRARRSQEFQVVTSGGQAEFGRALGGYINVVTKSGTKRCHGDLYGYFRNRPLQRGNPLSHTGAAVDSGAIRR